MNPLIKQLLMQSGVNSNWNEADWYSLSPEMVQKFAELIISECAAQITEAIPDTDCSASGAYKTAKIAAIARVKKHFGVRE